MMHIFQPQPGAHMQLQDLKGAKWAHRDTIKEGDMVRADAGFTCIPDGAVLTVRRDRTHEGFAGLCISCEDGNHWLSSQLGDDGELVGLYPA